MADPKAYALGSLPYVARGEESKDGDSCEFRSVAKKERVESGSRTLSRFGVEDEQIYLVIRDRSSHPFCYTYKNENNNYWLKRWREKHVG